jgi:hypothetical protein
VDGTSGGTRASAFQAAEVTQDVPGLGFQGLSMAINRDIPLTVQMPAGMTGEGTMAGVDNVCVVRVRSGAGAGPFGGSAALFVFKMGVQRPMLAVVIPFACLGSVFPWTVQTVECGYLSIHTDCSENTRFIMGRLAQLLLVAPDPVQPPKGHSPNPPGI